MGWISVAGVAAVAADKYFNYGYYTDGALLMLREIRRSFGW
jgi:hypothetical protein